MTFLDRRQFGKLSLSAFVLGASSLRPGLSLASNPTETPVHGLSAFGELGKPADFAQLDYANVDAPKGGKFIFTAPNWLFNQNPQTFDTLNTLVLKGNAPPRLELIFDTLMARAWDEPSAIYGLVAKDVTISADRNTYRFSLRPEARFHDGSPLTADDVAASYTLLKEKGHPDIVVQLRHLSEAVALSPTQVELRFNGQQSDRAILTAALLPIVSKAYYEANDLADSTLEAPLGSGPYKVGNLRAGAFIEYNRDPNWWARDLPVSRGQANFDTIRLEFYQDGQAAFEAFKKGDILFRQEFRASRWATEYNFPAFNDGRVKRQLFPSEKRPSTQALICNLRRPKLADPRTRSAINHCFDYEWTNRTLFFDAYARNQSYFQGSDFMAEGTPSEAELALLDPLRDQLDPAVFGEAIVPPVSNGSGSDRSLLRVANNLLREAGWKRDGQQLVDDKEEPFVIEFLLRSPAFERVLNPWVENLRKVGVTASIRLVDPAQYQRRLDEFDFDVTTRALGYAPTPTQESIEQIYGSRNANKPGSQNVAGLADPAVDALIEKIGTVQSRDELVIIMRALDRVLRSTHSWIPNWHSANHRAAFWDIYGIPETKPDYWFPVETTWWLDADKAAALEKGL
ncbi:MAG: extracellular solute-binding protein [Pseudomonadota bacterium]